MPPRPRPAPLTEDQARHWLQEWPRAQMHLTTFCRRQNLPYAELRQWKEHLEPEPTPATPAFLQLTPALPTAPLAPPALEPFELSTPAGLLLRIPQRFHDPALRQLLACLGLAPC